jgi:hypothetical protein
MNYLPGGFISLVTVSSGDVKPDDILSCFCQEDWERGKGFDLIDLISCPLLPAFCGIFDL